MVNKLLVYTAGDMLKYGSQLQREEEKKEIESLGFEVYSPKDDKEINDKQNQTKDSNDKLAEKIVKKDTDGIMKSNIILIEPHENALGTITELGQIKGMRDAFDDIATWIYENHKEIYPEFLKMFVRKYSKTVIPYLRDIRRTDIPEVGDRRSYGINQYVHGVVLDLTHGHGFYEWEEVLEKLKADEEHEKLILNMVEHHPERISREGDEN